LGEIDLSMRRLIRALLSFRSKIALPGESFTANLREADEFFAAGPWAKLPIGDGSAAGRASHYRFH
jgi:hypothetical protein